MIRKSLQGIALTLALAFGFTTTAQLALPQQAIAAEHKAAGDSETVEPVLALIASLLVPGLGQILAGETGRGIWFMVGCLGVIAIGVALAFITFGFGSICAPFLSLAYAIWAGLDAYKIAKAKREGTWKSDEATLTPRHGAHALAPVAGDLLR